MAQIGSVNATFTASVGGLTAGVDAAGKAFKALGGDATSLRTSLATLQKAGAQSVADIGPAAASAREAVAQFSDKVAALGSQFKAGAISAGQFAAGMGAVNAEAKAAAQATQDAIALTKQYASAESLLLDEMARVSAAVKLGGLSEEIATAARQAAIEKYTAAAAAANVEASAVAGLAENLDSLGGVDVPNPFAGVAEEFAASIAGLADESVIFSTTLIEQQAAEELAAEAAAAAAAAMRELEAVQARGAAVTLANATAEERHAATLAELNQLLSAGAISQQTYERATAAAAAKMQDSGAAAKTMDNGLAGVTSRLNVLIGLDIAKIFASIASTISGAVGSFISMGQAEAGVIDQTSKLAAKLGVTYGELAGISLAAERSGVSLETVKDSMTKADIAFTRAAAGSADAAAGFAAIGLSAAQLNGLGTADRFQTIAAAIAKLPTEAQRAAAATEIFGRAGADLLPLFAGGAEGIAAATAEANRFGTALTTAQGTDVRNMVSAFETAKTAIQGVVQQVTAYLAPAVTGVVNQFNEFIGNIGGANIGQAIGDGILVGAEYLAGIGDWIIANFKGSFEYLSKVGQQLGDVFGFLNRTVSFLSGVWNVAKAIFLGIVGSFTGAFQVLATIAQKIGQFLGFDTGTLDTIVAGAQAFNAEIDRGIMDAANGAARDFGAAFATDAAQVGQAVSGPLQDSVRSWREAATASAAQVEEAAKTPVEVKQTVQVNATQALKALDSRSKEGVAEMFRLMRGGTNNIPEQQLDALNRIADNTAGMEPLPAIELAGV
jgi:hypothetical protein